MYTASIVLLIFGISPKIGACLLWIPDPVIGGIFAVMTALPAAVGMSSLQFVNMNKSRNLFVLGFSVFMGIVIPGRDHRKILPVQFGLNVLVISKQVGYRRHQVQSKLRRGFEMILSTRDTWDTRPKKIGTKVVSVLSRPEDGRPRTNHPVPRTSAFNSISINSASEYA